MDHKKILQELSRREDLQNKVCNDCSNPNPQWASLSFAVFICLQCAGTHRGFGVHVSFVRSISMDTWQDEQVKRMQLGGNASFRDFMRSYSPVEQGGYSDSLSPYDTYHCWAATQYREKLDAMLAGKDWTPSAPPPESAVNSISRPSSAQGLRKSRTTSRAMTGSSLRSNSSSPASFGNSPRGTPDLSSSGGTFDQKTANESYFASLGQANANRPADLPPSQGGRYQGFGSTPTPAASGNPSFGLSSRAAPSLADLQENPMAALSKGWSLFSSAVAGASKVVNENIIQPGMEKVSDPELQQSVKGYLWEAQKKAAEVGSSANAWSKQQFGVDVRERVGSVMGSGPQGRGYDAIGNHDEETSSLYQDDTDDFFKEYNHGPSPTSATGLPSSLSDGMKSLSMDTSATSSTKNAAAKKKADDWDDEWKDF